LDQPAINGALVGGASLDGSSFYSLWRPVQMSDENKLAALIILDGFACRDEVKGNAVQQAKKPNFDRYWNAFPHNQLKASGRSVGLPEGQMGNSEVGHLN